MADRKLCSFTCFFLTQIFALSVFACFSSLTLFFLCASLAGSSLFDAAIRVIARILLGDIPAEWSVRV